MRNLRLGLRLSEIGSGSQALALILYTNTLNNFVYATDANGNTVLTNQGSSKTTNDGLLNTGRGLELGATNELPVPVHYTLGGNNFTGTIDSGPNLSHTLITDGYNLVCDGLGGTNYNATVVTHSVTAHTTPYSCMFPFMAVVNSGQYDIGGYYSDGTFYELDTPHTVVNGLNEIELKTRADTDVLYVVSRADVAFDVDITLIDINQITNPNSFLTYYDFATSQFIEVDNSLGTPSTTKVFSNLTLNNILNHTTNWDASDWAKINANPQLVAKLALSATGSISELNMVLDQGAVNDAWYPCSENSGAYVVDARDALGVENITTLAATYIEAGTGTITPNGVDANIDLTSPGTINYQPQLAYNIPSTLFIGVSVISFTLTVNSGTATIQGYQIGSRSDIGLNQTYGVGVHEIKYLSLFSTSSGNISVYFDGTATTFNADITNFSFKEATAEEITNYAETIRTNADFQAKGLQTTCLVLDGVGVPTAYDVAKLNFYGNGYDNTQFNPSLYSEFIIEESVGGVFYSHIYDGVNLTTWTDGVVGTPTAHTPENAEYLQGKGAYPKVTADGYATYTQNWFEVIDSASLIASYNASQAYEDWLIKTYGLTDEFGNYLTDEDGTYILQDY